MAERLALYETRPILSYIIGEGKLHKEYASIHLAAKDFMIPEYGVLNCAKGKYKKTFSKKLNCWVTFRYKTQNKS